MEWPLAPATWFWGLIHACHFGGDDGGCQTWAGRSSFSVVHLAAILLAYPQFEDSYGDACQSCICSCRVLRFDLTYNFGSFFHSAYLQGELLSQAGPAQSQEPGLPSQESLQPVANEGKDIVHVVYSL